MFSIDDTLISQPKIDDAFGPLRSFGRRIAAALRALTAADEAFQSVVPGDLVSREEVRFIYDEWRKSAT